MEIDNCHIDKFPEEILELIFEKYCEIPCNRNIKSLFNYRSTCKTWKFIIENSTQIMKQLTFNLHDWPAFLQSTLLTKVKSILVTQPFNGNKIEDWFKICEAVGNSIQIVKFDFSAVDTNSHGNIQLCIQMVEVLLKSATGLKELHILGADLLILSEDSMLTVHNNVEILFLCLSEAIVLKKILSNFPRLSKLVIRRIDKEESLLRKDSGDKLDLFTVLRDYINCKPGRRQFLQEIVLDELDQHCFHGDGQLNFILHCAEHGIKVTRTTNNGKDEIRFNLNKLFTRRRAATEESSPPLNQVTCQYLQLVTLNIHGDLPIQTNIIEYYCTNIQDLKIRFYRQAKLEEVSFLPKLKKLTNLQLIGQLVDYCGIEAFDSFEVARKDEDIQNIIFPMIESCKESIFPALKNLKIKGDLFGQQQFATEFYSTFFPNLESVSFVNLTVVPEEIFVHLSKLEYLKNIYINGGQYRGKLSFVDEMFIHPCKSVPKNECNNNMEIVPAIAAFKCLKSLTIINCQKLTDAFIINGIKLNKTLTNISIRDLDHVTFTIGICALRNTGFKCNQPTVSSCYDFTRDV